jgi:O-antigen/teichoic acid export membrane protein
LAVVAVARYTNDEIKARLILVVGIGLTCAFVGSIFTLLYGLLFVTQPLEQAPNDAEAWKILSPLTLTMSGVLAGLLASNGLKGNQNDKDKTND